MEEAAAGVPGERAGGEGKSGSAEEVPVLTLNARSGPCENFKF